MILCLFLLISSLAFGQGYNPIDSLKVITSQCKKDGVMTKWNIAVQNIADNDIKDIKFQFTYAGDSGTVIDTGTETAYQIFPAGKITFIELSEFVHSQATKCGAEIISAKWESEKGERNLDW